MGGSRARGPMRDNLERFYIGPGELVDRLMCFPAPSSGSGTEVIMDKRSLPLSVM